MKDEKVRGSGLLWTHPEMKAVKTVVRHFAPYAPSVFREHAIPLTAFAMLELKATAIDVETECELLIDEDELGIRFVIGTPF